jgi:hypothetical protein
MSVPDQPRAFRTPTPAERPWTWRLEDADGTAVDLTGTDAEEYADQRFLSQADAETWIGEVFQELLDAGVAQVTLLELDDEVYGPMGLSA